MNIVMIYGFALTIVCMHEVCVCMCACERSLT